MTSYEFEPWEIWNGGQCPCPGEMVQVQLDFETRQNAIQRRPSLAEVWGWDHSKTANVIAFRRVKSHRLFVKFGYFSKVDNDWLFCVDCYSDDTHKLTFSVDSEGNPYNFYCERIK